MELEPQQICLDVLREKYCYGAETSADDIRRRTARALAAVEDNPGAWDEIFFDAQRRGFVLGGRINAAAGTGLASTWANCFVQPVGDSIDGADETGQPGIFVAVAEAAVTMKKGGGVGYDFSRLRPTGARVRSVEAEASGPVSYQRVFDRMCETVQSAGARRGAQMGVLRVDHPDIEEFVHAKDRPGELTNFNLSVAVTNAFMEAVETDSLFDLVHEVEPSARHAQGREIFRRSDGRYVYASVPARRLWDQIMRSTYDHGEPGVIFIDRVNEQNNLHYCESITATNPCAEEPLPPYGCCVLGSLNLVRFVEQPFTPNAAFDFLQFRDLVPLAVRMLDNVIEATSWPLPAQAAEAQSKRRIGLGLMGLGDALLMLGIRYGSKAAVHFARAVGINLCDSAYRASVELAGARGAFPLFDSRHFLSGAFARSLPEDLRSEIREKGIRNSHLLAIAPTGTISLAFGDNVSNGIEPVFEFVTRRRKRRLDGGWDVVHVEDHAHRVYRHLGLPTDDLPESFVTAREICAADHVRMVAAVQPFIDASVSKTCNIAKDYPFEDFKDLYALAWRSGLKSLATFRENEITGSILAAATPEPVVEHQVPHDLDQSDSDRRIVLDSVPDAALNALRWPGRPELKDGNPAHCYRVKHPHGAKFALFIGHVHTLDGEPYPFETWVSGLEAPRGLNALAINLSFDMYARDRGWLKKKLESLVRCEVPGEEFELPMPPNGTPHRMPSLVAAMAALLQHRCQELGAFENLEYTPLLDALMSRKEPKTGPNGTMSWTVDVRNDATGDDFVLGLKELVIPKGARSERRPYSLWLSGDYPRTLDGLCKALSFDMRILDPGWVGKKLRELLAYAEPKGDFFAFAPGQPRQEVYPSTVAYIARLVIHRYCLLGILDETGYPVGLTAPMETSDGAPALESDDRIVTLRGKRCPACHQDTVVRIDGCDRCTHCTEVGPCG
jgi:ribonucleoside-diphosphate reductase alpha chain